MKVLIFLLFVCGITYGQEFRNEEMYMKDTIFINEQQIISDVNFFMIEDIKDIIKKYPDYDSLAYLDFASIFAMDSINNYRKSKGLDTIIFDQNMRLRLVDECIFDFVNEVKKPVLVKKVYEDICGCIDCYRDLVGEVFLHKDIMRSLNSKSLNNFNVAIFYAEKGDYIFCIETHKSIFYVKTYIK